MNFQQLKKTIDFNNVNWQDNLFCMSYYSDMVTLKQSILNVGILNLPLIQQVSRDRYRIVGGWRRLLALKELKKESFEAYVLNKDIPGKNPHRRLIRQCP